MKREIVHMVGTEEGAALDTGEVASVTTRCGRKINRPLVDGTASRYSMIAHNGNIFACTTRSRFVSCVKCMNLLNVGTIYAAQSRTTDTAKPSPVRSRARG